MRGGLSCLRLQASNAVGFILSDQTSECYISSSKAGGYDTAKALLNAVSDIFYKRTENAKICFNAENEVHIIQLISHDAERIKELLLR